MHVRALRHEIFLRNDYVVVANLRSRNRPIQVRSPQVFMHAFIVPLARGIGVQT